MDGSLGVSLRNTCWVIVMSFISWGSNFCLWVKTGFVLLLKTAKVHRTLGTQKDQKPTYICILFLFYTYSISENEDYFCNRCFPVVAKGNVLVWVHRLATAAGGKYESQKGSQTKNLQKKNNPNKLLSLSAYSIPSVYWEGARQEGKGSGGGKPYLNQGKSYRDSRLQHSGFLAHLVSSLNAWASE